MKAPHVAIAVSSTMLTRPISAAPPKIVPLETSSPPLPLALGSRSPTLLFSFVHTPMPPSTRYRNATAIIHTKNSETLSTNETFSTLHGSKRRICMLARTGPWERLAAEARVAGAEGRDDGSTALRSPALRDPRGAAPDRSG